MNRDDILQLCAANPVAIADFVLQLQATVAAQQEQITTLINRVVTLEARLKTDSHNSSKPPSSDPPAPKPVSLRQKSGRKPGGQAGHPGRTLALVDTPDVLVTHTPSCCAGCGANLADTPPASVERRQVADLPPLALVVTQHRSECKVCADCGHTTSAAFPALVTQPVQYGTRLQALSVYLLSYQLLPVVRARELLGDLFGVSPCPATLLSLQHKAAQTLEPTCAQIASALQHAPVVHCDESGGRVNGTLHWLHVASTPLLTHYGIHKKRGQAGMNAQGILPHLSGIAVHDGWASYFKYPCRHALCNAHHLRELVAVYEAAQDEQGWAQGMQTLLRDGKRAVEAARQAGHICLSADVLTDLTKRYKTLVQEGYAANPPPPPQPHKKGKPRQSKARNLLDRLHTYEEATLRFLHDFAVPFDNNQAERDVRMLKVQQKISGGFRTQEGAEAFCRVRSYISTLRKQGRHVLTTLQHVFAGNVPSPLPLPE